MQADKNKWMEVTHLKVLPPLPSRFLHLRKIKLKRAFLRSVSKKRKKKNEKKVWPYTIPHAQCTRKFFSAICRQNSHLPLLKFSALRKRNEKEHKRKKKWKEMKWNRKEKDKKKKKQCKRVKVLPCIAISRISALQFWSKIPT